MTIVTIDFETRSPVNLKTQGAHVYFEHPLTELMCLAVAVDGARPLIWVADRFAAKLDASLLKYEMISGHRMLDIVLNAEKVVAQNSMFEFLGWHEKGCKVHGWPALPLEKLYDTMAQLGYCALPLHLDAAGAALNLSIQKDAAGHKLMLKLCKPRTPRKEEREANLDWSNRLWWHEDPKELAGLVNYCCRDVEAERVIFHRLPQLPPQEREIWLLDQRINLRGVPVDLDSVEAIVACVDAREQKQLQKFQGVVDEKVSGPRSSVALKNWVNEQTGLSLASVDKGTVKDLLKNGTVTGAVAEALTIKAELGKSSVAKFKSMKNRLSRDGRLRGMFLYGGASTLRWAGRGVQMHNLPRDSYKPEDYEYVAELFKAGDTEAIRLLYDQPHYAASKCIRGSICTSKWNEFICADFSAIEARGLAYLANEKSVLSAFWEGKDTYKVAAQEIFNIVYEAVTKDQRQIGKVSELQLGYGGGIGAWSTMAKNYGIDLEDLPAHILPHATEDELEGDYGAWALAGSYLTKNPGAMSLDAAAACDVIKRKWRAARPAITGFWKGIGEAAFSAVQNPGRIYACRAIKYVVHDDFLKCLLPSGRVMFYYQPRIKDVVTSWGEAKKTITYMGMKVVDGKTTRQWARLATYGPKLVENITQAFCRDILAESMIREDKEGYPIVLHVHDEAAAELPVGQGSLEKFIEIMEVVPSWATGMPIKAEGWVGRRFRK